MVTTRANPSSRTARTAPRPSTWPWTMWPPSRSEARSASSRFTPEPAATSASDERRSVSCITSARNSPPSIAVAVRQTPSTATESPSAIWPASRVRTPSVTPSAFASTAVTVPRSCTSPVNTSPLPEPGGDQHVAGDPLDVERERARRLRDPLDALALERVARVRAADEDRGEEQPQLVELARVEERAGQLRAALEQDRREVGGAELVERRAHARRLVLPRRDDHLGARGLQRVGLQPRRGPPDDDRQGELGRAAHELRVERQPALGVEDDPARLARDAGDPRVELRVVGQRGADPDDDGVALGAPVMRQQARLLAGDPLRVAGARGDLAVERHRRLEQHVRAAGARVLAERLVDESRAGRRLAVGDDDLDALVAHDPEP